MYRPQSFEEMSGQQHVKQTLQNALLHQKTTHAYLFSGPRGTGKTSAAKIFAKALNCENGPAKEPCNTCPTCISITEGSNTDVTEFDAASNSRVEEMRDIIERVHVAPSNAKFKVYIIDEVHMLSNSAFNALLKTLEEPPSHVVFILATTEPHKLPLTIISRCQRFDFKPITSLEIVERMKTVLLDTNIEAEDNALKIIAQAAAGGMRDALSMLDQAVSFSGQSITAENALLVTGSIGESIFYELAQALLEKDAGGTLSLLENLIREGKDVGRLAEDLITFFRDLLLLKTAPTLTDLLEIISEDVRFVELAERFDVDQLYGFIDILAKTQQEMRFSNHAKVYLESALLKMTQVQSKSGMQTNEIAPQIEQKITQLEQLVNDLQQQLASGVRNPYTQDQPAPPKRGGGSNTRAIKIPTGKVHEILQDATKEDVHMIREQWANMMNTLQKSHAALLDETEPVAASRNAFVLKFKYEIHCLMASENPTLRSSLSNALQQFTGKPYEVIYVPEDSWLTIREEFIKKHQLSKQPQASSGLTEDVMDSNPSSYIEEEQVDPIVAEAEKLFGKEFIEIHDD